MSTQPRAPRNRTISLTAEEVRRYESRLLKLEQPTPLQTILGKTIHQDLFEALPYLPAAFADLVIADPPYNLDKSFNGKTFKSRSLDDYEAWLESWLLPIRRILKPTATLYICGDWRSSSAIQRVAQRHFTVQNRITWEREKGRGALSNWKNCSEDIWFLTNSPEYTFHVDAVKLKRRVLAPYRDGQGKPKDWQETNGGNYRDTHPSNLWTDISIPFWSMPENTDHPTQKPEKLIAKLILASSNPHAVVFDPFLGSGTTSVVAKKLDRNFVGVEIDHQYCCLTEKRLSMAERDQCIQGYHQGVFWERNTLAEQQRPAKTIADSNLGSLFSNGDYE